MATHGWTVLLYLLLSSVISAPSQGQTYIGEVGHGGSGVPIQLVIPNRDDGPNRHLPNHTGGTVVVGVALSEGLVLAADSRMVQTFPVSPGYKVVSDSASKLFDVSSYGIAVYGEAFLVGRSIGSYIQDFRRQIEKDPAPDVRGFAKRFSEYISGPYEESSKGKPVTLGFTIAGYGTDGIGRIISIDFPGGPTPVERYNTHTNQGACWSGQTDVISRVIKGIEPRIVNLPSMGALSRAQLEQLNVDIPKIEYNVPYSALALQDGIDFALFLVQATVDVQRFSFGTLGNPGDIPGVGGPVDVVAITPFKLEWIKKKTLAAK